MNDNNFVNQGLAMAAQQQGLLGGLNSYVDLNATPRTNLERKIRAAKATLENLEAQLKEMEKTGLADIKIETIRQAMNY